MSDAPPVFLWLAAAIFLGFAAAVIAHAKGRPFLPWWLYGLVLGVIAVPHALLMRDESVDDPWVDGAPSSRRRAGGGQSRSEQNGNKGHEDWSLDGDGPGASPSPKEGEGRARREVSPTWSDDSFARLVGDRPPRRAAAAVATSVARRAAPPPSAARPAAASAATEMRHRPDNLRQDRRQETVRRQEREAEAVSAQDAAVTPASARKASESGIRPRPLPPDEMPAGMAAAEAEEALEIPAAPSEGTGGPGGRRSSARPEREQGPRLRAGAGREREAREEPSFESSRDERRKGPAMAAAGIAGGAAEREEAPWRGTWFTDGDTREPPSHGAWERYRRRWRAERGFGLEYAVAGVCVLLAAFILGPRLADIVAPPEVPGQQQQASAPIQVGPMKGDPEAPNEPPGQAAPKEPGGGAPMPSDATGAAETAGEPIVLPPAATGEAIGTGGDGTPSPAGRNTASTEDAVPEPPSGPAGAADSAPGDSLARFVPPRRVTPPKMEETEEAPRPVVPSRTARRSEPAPEEPAPAVERISAVGQLVVLVQAELRKRGYEPGPVNGRAGEQTRQAINAFKRSQGLPADGLIDDELLQRLGISGPRLHVFDTP